MTKVPCQLTDVSGSMTRGEGELAALSSSERLLRSTKRASIFVGVALVCVLIPMLHFVLVPGFLIVAIFMFVKTMQESSLITEVRSECPACHQQISLKGPIQTTGSKEICPNCRQLLKLQVLA